MVVAPLPTGKAVVSRIEPPPRGPSSRAHVRPITARPMTRARTIACLLLCASCAPTPEAAEDATPVAAARSFLEAGRRGDTEAARRCLVAAERRRPPHVDYRDLGAYTLCLEGHLDERRAVVTVAVDDVHSPLVTVRQGGRWRVSIRETLRQMQAPRTAPLASAPR